MGISVLLLTAVCALVIIKIVNSLYKRYQLVTLIDKIPGPKAYPIIGNALTLASVSREDRYSWIQNICRQYTGGIFRVWVGMTPEINITSPEMISSVLHNKNLLTKAIVMSFGGPWIGTGLLTSTGEKWHRQRKLITPTFHINLLQQSAVVMTKKAEILKEIIASEIENDPKKPVEMFGPVYRCALEIMYESMMGLSRDIQRKRDNEYLAALQSIANEIMERYVRPWLYDDWIYHRTSHSKNLMNAVETTRKLRNQVIAEKKLLRKAQKQEFDDYTDDDKPKRKAFLDHLLDACDRDNMPLSDDDLRQEVDTFIFEGHATTAISMTWALLCVGNHPDVQEKVHEELWSVYGDSTEPTTFEQLSELKYLERVIKETLRLFPSLPFITRTITEDVEIGGYKIPEGTMANLHIAALHRDPHHWPNPEKFDPDRFLPENSQGRHPSAYIPFGAGSRNCIGQKFAMSEEKIILSTLLRTWRVKSIMKWDEIKCYTDVVLTPQSGVHVSFTRK